MRNPRPILVAAAAALLSGVAVIGMAAREPADAPGPTWKVTQLRDGRPAGSVQVDHELPADMAELFGKPAGPGETYLVERLSTPAGPGPSFFTPNRLPPAQRRLAEFLLLLPLAALLVCVCRNVVGLNSFGTFAPALLGLALRDSPLYGAGIVAGVLAAGGLFRHGLERFHLLQVPRAALLLSLIALVLLLVIPGGGRTGTLLPLVILTGMIERYWALEEEAGPAVALRTLLTTLGMAGAVWALTAIPAVPRLLMRHPEAIGLVMAAQLLLGRYTGLRLLECYRFRALADYPPLARRAA